MKAFNTLPYACIIYLILCAVTRAWRSKPAYFNWVAFLFSSVLLTLSGTGLNLPIIIPYILYSDYVGALITVYALLDDLFLNENQTAKPTDLELGLKKMPLPEPEKRPDLYSTAHMSLCNERYAYY